MPGSVEDRLKNLIAEVRDPDIRKILSISQERAKYPRDCIVDGALEKLVKYILELESNG